MLANVRAMCKNNPRTLRGSVRSLKRMVQHREDAPSKGGVLALDRGIAKRWDGGVSLLQRLERRAQLVGECPEALGGRSGIAFRPFAHFLGLARFRHCL